MDVLNKTSRLWYAIRMQLHFGFCHPFKRTQWEKFFSCLWKTQALKASRTQTQTNTIWTQNCPGRYAHFTPDSKASLVPFQPSSRESLHEDGTYPPAEVPAAGPPKTLGPYRCQIESVSKPQGAPTGPSETTWPGRRARVPE